MKVHRSLLAIGALSGFLGVALGAFAAHGLRDTIPPDLLAVFETGVRYELVHAVVIVVCALLAPSFARAATAAWCFIAGTAIFSGSLYILALTGIRAFGAVTPFGGVLFLAGWAFLALAAFTRAARS